MLVLSRKVGSRIQIGDDIVLTVTAIKGKRVQLGIDAPKDVSIRRGELLEFSSREQDTDMGSPQDAAREKQVA